MYIEKRKQGKRTKYYLVYSYRKAYEVKKIRRYLGSNLSGEELQHAKLKAQEQIKEDAEELRTELFHFSLTKKQREKLNRYDAQIKIYHLEHFDWKRFTEQFVYNTNAIEGSTIQLDKIPEILNKEKGDGAEERETKGVAKAVDYLRKTKEELSLALIKKLHQLCFVDSKHFAGEFRKKEVVIMDGLGNIVHRGISVQRLSDELEYLIMWYKKNKKKFKPLILAAIIHNQFEHIHPFEDGNGRVGRLLLNFILIRNKYPPINITLEDRVKYYASLQEYSRSKKIQPTILFLIEQYKKTLQQVSTKKKKR